MSDKSIKLSVIIPVWNVEKYLRKCLESIISQSLKDIEILVIDDNSKDGSWDVVQEFARKDHRIVTLRHWRNKGVSASRNACLRLARGEYIGFIDADDYVDTNYFEALYSAAKTKKADIVTAYVTTEDAGRQRFYNHTNKREVQKNKANLKGVIWLNIYKRSMIEQHQIKFLPKLRTAEDNLFNLHASYYANKIESINENEAYYHHVSRDGSLMTEQYDGRSLLLLSDVILETVKLMNEIDDYEKEVYINRLLDTLIFFYKRFTESNRLNNIVRLRISFTFIQIWKAVKYRKQLLKLISDKDMDLRKLMHGKIADSLYEKYVEGYKGDKVHNKKQARDKMRSVMGIAKRILKAALPHGFVVLYKRRLELLSKVTVSGGKGSLDNRKIAVIVPFRNVKYVELVKLAVERAGYEAVDTPSDAQYIWIHWYENGINNYADFLNKLSTIKTWKDQGRKVILHIHNKKPHESPVPQISHALMTSLADSVDQVVIMSTETKNVLKNIWYYGEDFSKASIVPHPNYIDVYGKKAKPSSSLKNDTLKILFFGLVRPYKGIEHLLEATKGMKNIEISIFGKPKDDEYVAKVMELSAGRNNVKFRLEHIPDEDIPRIFADHHLVALPYSKESSLNSGAAMLALSYGRTIIGTNNGTLKDLESRELYFGYDYSDERDHVRQLKNTIQIIQKKYDGKYNELLKVGERAYKSIEKNNSIEVVSKSIDDMIKRLG